jgi:lipopolysaccharide transport system ATP-binding protein
VSGSKITTDVDIQNDVRIEIEFWNYRPDARITASIHLLDKLKTGVLASANLPSANLVHDQWFDKLYPAGVFRTVCTLPGNFLNEGRYHINVILLTNVTNMEVFLEQAMTFDVYESGTMRGEYGGDWLGVVRPKLAWQTEHLNANAVESQEQTA